MLNLNSKSLAYNEQTDSVCKGQRLAFYQRIKTKYNNNAI